MRKEDQVTAVVSVAALISALIVGRYYITEFFTEEHAASCAVMAKDVAQLNVTGANGQPMTPIELHTRLGGGARGVVKNARVIAVKSEATNAAIEVSIPKGSTSPRQPADTVGGIVFQWEPRLLGDANSACLRYALKVPSDFDPGTGGTLPGLFGGTLLDGEVEADGTNGFSARTVWDRNGKLKISGQLPVTKTSNPSILARGKYDLPKGKWLWIDQELVLNQPGEQDGSYRLWIDGKIAFDQSNIIWRTDPGLRLRGATGAAHYGMPGRNATAPADTVITLTPLELSRNEN